MSIGVLGEPTNDLDSETLTALEDVLDGWAGTLLVVSHDRYLLERMCDRQVALLGDGRIRDLPGGVEQYLALRAAGVAAGAVAGSSGPGTSDVGKPGAAAETGPAVGAGRSLVGGERAASAGEARQARKEMARIERRLSRIEEGEARLHARMAEQAADHAAVLALDEELRVLLAERDELEAAWLEAAEVAEP